MRLLIAAGVAAALTLAGFLLVPRILTSSPTEPFWQTSLPQWGEILGGEDAISAQRIKDLNAINSGLDGDSLQQARRAATAAALSNLTGVPYGEGSYDPPAQGTTQGAFTRCQKVSLLGESLVAKEADSSMWAKALVLYSGKCGQTTYTKASPGVEYVYLELTEQGWQPRWQWQTPGAGSSTAAADLDPGALVDLGPCGVTDGRSFQARPRVAVAFQRLCQAAKEDGVVLVVSSAFRSRVEQKDLFDQAVEHYGSAAEAAKWVAPADDAVCASRHCTGLAVGVEPDAAATGWLSSIAYCLTSKGSKIPASSGCAGSEPVTHAQSFGFATPPGDLPGYLEYVLPAGLSPSGKAPADCSPYGEQVPAIIASVFRCRLAEAGVPPAAVETAVQEALAVAKCSSELNPQATVFNGEFAAQVKPGTNRIFPLGGLFALAPSDGSWMGASLADPVSAANYAAKLWLVDRSFSRFFCATGADADLSSQAGVPSFSGPALPSWVKQW